MSEPNPNQRLDRIDRLVSTNNKRDLAGMVADAEQTELELRGYICELMEQLRSDHDEAKGWQAEWTKVIHRERAYRRCIEAARPLVDDDEWHERAEAVLSRRPT